MTPDAEIERLEDYVRKQTVVLIEAVEDEMRRLRVERDSLNQRIRELARKRMVYARALTGEASHTPSGRLAKPACVTEVLEDVYPNPLSLRDIHAELVRRGWSTDEGRDKHALEVAVRAMERRGDVDRPRRGWYRLRKLSTDRRPEAA